MIEKIKVTFDMSFNYDRKGSCKTNVQFEFSDHQKIEVTDDIKALVISQIRLLCGAIYASRAELFSDIAPATIAELIAENQP